MSHKNDRILLRQRRTKKRAALIARKQIQKAIKPLAKNMWPTVVRKAWCRMLPKNHPQEETEGCGLSYSEFVHYCIFSNLNRLTTCEPPQKNYVIDRHGKLQPRTFSVRGQKHKHSPHWQFYNLEKKQHFVTPFLVAKQNEQFDGDVIIVRSSCHSFIGTKQTQS